MNYQNQVNLRGLVRSYRNYGQGVIRFSLYTASAFTSKSGQSIIESQWHNIVCYADMPELTKDNAVEVQGRLRTTTYVDTNGIQHYNTEIVADKVAVLDEKNLDLEMR